MASSLKMDVSFINEGRRVYLSGNTYPIKSDIKAVGGHWDGDRKMWWIGATKQAEIERAVARATPQPQTPRETLVKGKASYKRRSYYVLWAGRTSKGTDAFRLTTLDEKITFWADASACRWEKHYQEPKRLAGIRKFVEDKRAEEKDGVPRTRQSHAEMVDMLDQMDDFDGARRYAQQHGIPY